MPRELPTRTGRERHRRHQRQGRRGQEQHRGEPRDQVRVARASDVVLLDADLGLANADVLCNIDLPCNLSHVIARKKELHEVMVKPPADSA